MKLTIVYDNRVYKKNMGLKPDWGFSCLLETSEDTVLFDTGAKGNILLNNMKKLDINPENIKKIVISHEHRDHSGGLKSLMPLVKSVELYRLDDKNFNRNIHFISAEKSKKITERIFTTGRLKGLTDEQSLILNGKKGWYILAGCSHPGVEKIFTVAKKYGKIIGIVGGLHGFDNFSFLEGFKFICPCHCTRFKKEIFDIFSDFAARCGVGRTFDL